MRKWLWALLAVVAGAGGAIWLFVILPGSIAGRIEAALNEIKADSVQVTDVVHGAVSVDVLARSATIDGISARWNGAALSANTVRADRSGGGMVVTLGQVRVAAASGAGFTARDLSVRLQDPDATAALNTLNAALATGDSRTIADALGAAFADLAIHEGRLWQGQDEMTVARFDLAGFAADRLTGLAVGTLAAVRPAAGQDGNGAGDARLSVAGLSIAELTHLPGLVPAASDHGLAWLVALAEGRAAARGIALNDLMITDDRNRLAFGTFRVDSITQGGISGLVVESMDMAVADFPEQDDGFDTRLDSLTLESTPIELASLAAVLDMAAIPARRVAAVPPGRFSAAGISALNNLVSVKSVEIPEPVVSEDGDYYKAMQISVDDFAMPLPRTVAGLETLKVDFTARTTLDRDSATANSQTGFDVQDAGKIELAVDLANVTDNFFRLFAVQPSGTEAADFSLPGFLQATGIAKLTLDYADSGFASKGFAFLDSAFGIEPQMIKFAVGSLLRDRPAAPGGTTGEAAAEIGRFIDDPRTLHISATPGEPIGIMTLLRQLERDPGDLLSRIDLYARAGH